MNKYIPNDNAMEIIDKLKQKIENLLAEVTTYSKKINLDAEEGQRKKWENQKLIREQSEEIRLKDR